AGERGWGRGDPGRARDGAPARRALPDGAGGARAAEEHHGGDRGSSHHQSAFAAVTPPFVLRTRGLGLEGRRGARGGGGAPPNTLSRVPVRRLLRATRWGGLRFADPQKTRFRGDPPPPLAPRRPRWPGLESKASRSLSGSGHDALCIARGGRPPRGTVQRGIATGERMSKALARAWMSERVARGETQGGV